MEEEPTEQIVHANAGRILGEMLGGGIEREGDSIGPYRLCELLGEGGFGNVWRAEQTLIVKREVALKVVKPGMDSAQVLGRFNQERQALASLEHPNIATLLDAGMGPNGRPYFAMELVRGGTLTSWCEAREATLRERLRLFIQVCLAVQHAHEKGILHRDLKPTNILVAEQDGQPLPKVIDFGIAKAMHAAVGDEMSVLTQADQVIGTPVYMSPEQVKGGRELDARSDVYALGVLLYELLTGTTPFDLQGMRKGGIDAMKYLILETVPERPSTRVRQRTGTQDKLKTGFQKRLSALPADLDWITMRALEKDRQRRYGTAAELAADIQRHLDNLPVLARPPSVGYKAGRWFRRHRTGTIAAGIALCLSGVVAMVTQRLSAPVKTPRQAALAAMRNGFTNSLGMKFLPIPGTELMGCIHETRRADYAAFASETAGVDESWKESSPNIAIGDNHPVSAVSWQEAVAFCGWLSRKEGRAYRLPTDQEWSALAANSSSAAGGTAGDRRYPAAAPVMSSHPNISGMFDAEGNVMEWVQDWQDHEMSERVVRGGNWADTHAHPDERRSFRPDTHDPLLGFRVVLVPAAKPESVLPEVLEPPQPVQVAASPRFRPLTDADAFTNSLGMKFVPVPGGQVLYCIHETRRRDYAAYQSPCGRWKDEKNKVWMSGNPEDCPVNNLAWKDAKGFCDWLSEKESKVYTLPTDEEWSIAAGLGLGAPAPLTAELLAAKTGNYADTAFHKEYGTQGWISGYTDGFSAVAPVMSLAADARGLYDMGGNVREWIEDKSAAQDFDIVGNMPRTARGGSWSTDKPNLALRQVLASGVHDNETGFRLVMIPADRVHELRPNLKVAAAKPPVEEAAHDTSPEIAVPAGAVVNSLDMVFLPVPGTPVLFCRHETRYKDYAAYARETPEAASAWKHSNCYGLPAGHKPDHPVVGVSWQDAQDFCAWLGRKEGGLYRLPTDAEWSLAAGLKEERNEGTTPEMLSGRDASTFAWGGDYPPKTEDQAGNFGDEAWHRALPGRSWLKGYDDGYATTAPVMSFKPNRHGLYDMAGNADEWCEDWYNADARERTIRDICYEYSSRSQMLASYRHRGAPDKHMNGTGFRCVLVPGAPPPPRPEVTAAKARPAPDPTPLPEALARNVVTNSLGMKFLPVPGTRALFCIHETRHGDYAAYAADVPGIDGTWAGMGLSEIPENSRAGYPVVGVSVEEAERFCVWLSRKEGRIARLPTDDEWNCAVGIADEIRIPGVKSEQLDPLGAARYPWGGSYPPAADDVRENYADDALHAKFPGRKWIAGYNDGFAGLAPVMSFKPNPFGLYDMGGNVNEFCQGWRDDKPGLRLVRGACFWDSDSRLLLSSFRGVVTPGRRSSATGFRVVLETGPAASTQASPTK